VRLKASSKVLSIVTPAPFRMPGGMYINSSWCFLMEREELRELLKGLLPVV